MTRISSTPSEPLLPTPRGRVTPAVRYRVMDRQAGLCAACGEPLAPGFAIDHRIPLALGGEDVEANYQAPDFTCHARKTAQDLADIAKAKRRAFKAAGGKKPTQGRLKSRGFQRFAYPDLPEGGS